MVKKHRVHGLTHSVVSAKRKRNVADAAADLCQGQRRLDDACGLYKTHRIVIVLLHPGGNGKDIRVKNNVLWWESDFPCQQFIRSRANLDAAIGVVGLALLVECHHHHSRPEAADQPRLLEKRLLSLLETDRVDYTLTLDTLEPGLDD